ncbi:hypothetical protein Q2T40_15170 [Winogradskyella maritima]|uniref:Uncharacterized protein n=1 Tax=Winogradskyella maritima TaxID=1517766 RepID=A0ABV8AFN4_9FLAO|nr:hypothetical protein [Winogradskyella maritima]
MEITVTTQDFDPGPEPGSQTFAVESLSNSNYKKLAAQNYSASTSKSVFGIRQHLKIKQFNMVNHIDVALKLSIFLTVIAIMF